MYYKTNNNTLYHSEDKVSFKSNLRVITDATGKVINRNSTSFFRNDMDWDAFFSLLINKYEKNAKVNIHDYACSDGSEAFSIVSYLMSNLSKGDADKFFPIIAKDVDQEIINRAKNGICGVFETDLKQIKSYIENADEFFKPVRLEGPDTSQGLLVSKQVKDKIVFEQADILKDLDSLRGDNNVILCRNFWKYLGEENYDLLAKKLYDKTKNNGLVVIGQYDLINGVPRALIANNFKSTFLPNVFEANPIKAKSIQELLVEMKL